MSDDKRVNDWWGFAEAAKRAVQSALTIAKFNPGNRAGHVAARAVLNLIQGADGIRLDKMYDSIGVPTRFPKYSSVDEPVCTIRVDVTIHNQDFEKLGEFRFEKSWMKDPRERYMDAGQRILYIENIAYPAAMLEMYTRRKEMIDAQDPNVWPANCQLSITQIFEMRENTRSVT